MNYKNAYEELKKIYEKLEDKYIHNVPCCNEENCGLFKEYQQLKDNWNKLKEWLKEETIKLELYKDNMDIDEYVDKKFLLKKVLDKLQEIEGGMNE